MPRIHGDSSCLKTGVERANRLLLSFTYISCLSLCLLYPPCREAENRRLFSLVQFQNCALFRRIQASLNFHRLFSRVHWWSRNRSSVSMVSLGTWWLWISWQGSKFIYWCRVESTILFFIPQVLLICILFFPSRSRSWIYKEQQWEQNSDWDL